MDIGCGDGFFVLPAARLVGEEGKVYGLDIDREVIDRLKEEAAREGLRNLDLKVGEAEAALLCEACADIIFFGSVLHDFKDPAMVLMNAKRMLKHNGHLVNLDWEKEHIGLTDKIFGPPLWKRFSAEEAGRLIEEAGFRIETVKEAGPHHYMITAKP